MRSGAVLQAPVVAVAPGPRPRIPRPWLICAGVVFAVLLGVALWPSGAPPAEEQEPGNPGEGDERRPSSAVGMAALLRPKPEVYVPIDRELSGKNREQALALIRTARDQFPQDGGLLWREGRALALARAEAERVSALHRYAEALAAEPALAEETEFVAELRNLLRDPKLRATAIDVAVRELGAAGHSFLLETINDEAVELGYVDRQRILAQLRSDPALIQRVDARRQLTLDLEQAASAPAPCTAFADALNRIAEADDPHYLAPLADRDLEIPEAAGVGETEADCEDLAQQRERVEGALRAAHPDEAAKLKKSSGGKKKKKKGGFRLPF